jgi:serine/threonine protein kinase
VSETAKDKRLVLEVVGEARGAVELPRQGVMTIGSAEKKADVHLSGQGVADVHCAIGRIKGGGWALKDLGSEGGTFVNGERVQQRRLEEGDLVLVGSRRLRVVDPEQPSPRAEPARVEPAAKAVPKPSAPSEPAMPKPITATQVAAQTLPQVRGYRVERQLGRGGMGEVYLAVQESLDRKVALKVLSSKLSADADFVRRFQAEAKAAAALNHPNVVTVHDVWEESGRHFLAMEFMDHGELETRVARGSRIAVKEVLEVLSDMAKALVYAEHKGIVHRDIKPANLMQNAVGTTKLADLGLATHLEAEATESDNKKIFGTPHFISPEQARGEKVDGRSDLYSLGATIYRLLSGHTPFEGATTRDILRGHFFDQPKPLAELASDVPPELARIVHKLLEKKPDDRYPSASALLHDVERLKSAAVHGIQAPAPAKKSKTGTWIALGGAAVAAIALATIFFGGDKQKDDSTNAANSRRGTSRNLPRNTPDPSGPSQPTSGDNPPREGGSTPSRRPSDSDLELKLREKDADLAYMRLPADLPLSARRDELVRLSTEFAGTTAAGKWAEEIERLNGEIERTATATSERDQARQRAIDGLRRSALAGDAPMPLDQALPVMLAQPIPLELASEPQYLNQRRQVFADVVRGAVERGRAALQSGDALAASGDFEGMSAQLRPWRSALTLPDISSEPGLRKLPEFEELEQLRAQIGERLDNLESAKSEFSLRRSGADGARLASGLHGASGIEHGLRSLDLGGLDAQLSSLEGELQTPEAKEFARALRDDVRAAKRSLDVVVAAFGSGGWKRKTLSDPRARSRANREALGVGPDGVQLKTDAASELVPWSAFGGRPSDLSQLFEKRLTREYTRDELVGIEALMRSAAVLQALDEAAEMFSGDAGNVLTEEEAKNLVEGFEIARPWADQLHETARLEREANAAKVLASALRAYSTGAWTVCVSDLERLLAEYRATLLVRLLSDGTSPLTLVAPTADK